MSQPNSNTLHPHPPVHMHMLCTAAVCRLALLAACCSLPAALPPALGLQPGFQLLFYGDSITESYRGTDHCLPCDRCKGAPEVFARHWGQYNASAIAIGGDQTAHLLWRLAHGEAPKVHKVSTGWWVGG